MIVNQNGQLVWFHPLAAGSPRPTSTSSSTRDKVLTWWQGRILEVGFGQGEDEIFNGSYQHDRHGARRQRLPRRPARNPADARRHRLDRRLRPDRGRPRRPATASADGVVTDSVVRGDRRQDRTGDVGVARARARPARRLVQRRPRQPDPGTTSTSTRSIPGPPATCCSRRATPGRCMTSTCTPGRSSGGSGASTASFKLGPGTAFHWQHDAAWQPGGLVSVFDNGGAAEGEAVARAAA